jgi:PAS domain S-box-containing protein
MRFEGSSEFLCAVLESIDAAIVACDHNGRIVLFNRTAEELLGFPDKSLPPEHALYQALTGADVRGVEMEQENGAWSADVKAVLDESGKTVGALAVWRDVTEHRRVARLAEQRRKQLEMVLESTSEGIYGISMDGLCTFINGSAAAMLGFAPHEIVGRNVHRLIHHTTPSGDPYPAKDCPIYAALRQGRGCSGEHDLFFRADSSAFPVEYSSYPIYDEGVPSGAIVTFIDATHRKRTEEALRAAEEKYRGLFENVSEGVYQTSPNGELLTTNPALIHMLGYSSEHELRALDVKDLYVNPEDRAAFSEVLEREGKLTNQELKLKRKDGTILRVLENSRAVRDERKKVLYFEGTLTPTPD